MGVQKDIGVGGMNAGFPERVLRFSIRNTLPLTIGSLLWSGAAIWIYFSLPVSLLPNLNFPILSVVVEDPGLTAEEMEKQVALPMESALSGITNIRRVRSTSVSNLTLVTVQLNWGADLETGRQQVMQKIAGVQSSLPVGAQASLESLSSTLGQIQGFVLSGNISLTDLHDFVDVTLKPLLLQQERRLRSSGFRRHGEGIRRLRQARTIAAIRFNPERHRGRAGPEQRRFRRRNIGFGRAKLRDRRANPDDRPGWHPKRDHRREKQRPHPRPRRGARFRQPSSVSRRSTEQGTVLGGVVVEVIKQPDADSVAAVARRVQNFIDGYRSSLPAGVRIEKFYDQSGTVLDSIRGMEEAVVVLGAALVALILLLFLRSGRAALVAFTSIPTSLLSAMVFIKALGMSVNIMTLSALRSRDRHGHRRRDRRDRKFFLRHRALKPRCADRNVVQLEAAAEVAGPVASSTITTVAIFVPLIFLSGLAGRLFSPVGVVVSIVMMASLFFAFTLIPSVGPHLMKHAAPQETWDVAARRIRAKSQRRVEI